MSKLALLPPAYTVPPRDTRAWQFQQGPYGPVASSCPARNAKAQGLSTYWWWYLTNVRLDSYRRWWLARLATAWKTDLTNAQRAAWTALAATTTITNWQGTLVTLNGFELFHHYNDFAAHLDNLWPPDSPTHYAAPIPDAPPTWDAPPAPTLTGATCVGLGNVNISADNSPYLQPHWTVCAWLWSPDAHPTKRPGQYHTGQVQGAGGTPPNFDWFTTFRNVPGEWLIPAWLTIGVRYLSEPNHVPGPLAWISVYVF